MSVSRPLAVWQTWDGALCTVQWGVDRCIHNGSLDVVWSCACLAGAKGQSVVILVWALFAVKTFEPA